jgi:hypothetical protein
MIAGMAVAGMTVMAGKARFNVTVEAVFIYSVQNLEVF